MVKFYKYLFPFLPSYWYEIFGLSVFSLMLYLLLHFSLIAEYEGNYFANNESYSKSKAKSKEVSDIYCWVSSDNKYSQNPSILLTPAISKSFLDFPIPRYF